MVRHFFLAITFFSSGVFASAANVSHEALRQLDYGPLRDASSVLKADPGTNSDLRLSERRIPELVSLSEITGATLQEKAIPLPNADTLSRVYFRANRIGRALEPATGAIKSFIPQIVLVKFRNSKQVSALRVAKNSEVSFLRKLSERQDVEFAELDFVQQRQFTPSDTSLTNQWHHTRIGSFSAWDKHLGSDSVRIAIVDTPFQMDHPDLAANTIPGWDVVDELPVTGGSGIAHSTIGAGLAAAVINNGIGVAGAGNCSILPINIEGAISEMYNAIIWAADHGVRIVNISWTGADSSTLNEAGLYLREKTDGVLAMAGVNGTGFLDYPNHPYIVCVSMTDAADNMRSRNGNHIDFAAPGFQVYSTSIGSSYATDSGTSYSTPLFCGVLGVLFSINPALSAEDALEILKNTAVDKGQPGWDQFYGWGRIDFAAAAQAAQNTMPKISAITLTNNAVVISVPQNTHFSYSLLKTESLDEPSWIPVANSTVTTNGEALFFTDPAPAESKSFYRLQLQLP